MENQPYQACARAFDGQNRWFMGAAASRVDAFTAADLPKQEKPRPAPVSKIAPAAKPARAAKAVKHFTPTKALASRVRLAAIQISLDGSAFTATAMQIPVDSISVAEQCGARTRIHQMRSDRVTARSSPL